MENGDLGVLGPQPVEKTALTTGPELVMILLLSLVGWIVRVVGWRKKVAMVICAVQVNNMVWY